MDYLEYTFENFSTSDEMEITIAKLNDIGFEGFVEDTDVLTAYCQEEDSNSELINEILKEINPNISYSCTLIPRINWNARWESDFKTVEVDDEVIIRASFHIPQKQYKYDLLIDPKMSFGTGHHETTRLMVKAMLKLDFVGTAVLDMGCGTGILGILASKMGAKTVDAIDIDDWACTNTEENAQTNNIDNISIEKGDSRLLGKSSYNIILANINRNVLLEDMKKYIRILKDGGTLLLSGFMTQDEQVILEEAKKLQLNQSVLYKEQNWLSVVLLK